MGGVQQTRPPRTMGYRAIGGRRRVRESLGHQHIHLSRRTRQRRAPRRPLATLPARGSACGTALQRSATRTCGRSRSRQGGAGQALGTAVTGGVVGDAVPPAAPDHVHPRPGQHPRRMRMIVTAGVDVRGPRARQPRVAGPLHQRVAQLAIHRPAEPDDAACPTAASTGTPRPTKRGPRGWGTGRGCRRSRPATAQPATPARGAASGRCAHRRARAAAR